MAGRALVPDGVRGLFGESAKRLSVVQTICNVIVEAGEEDLESEKLSPRSHGGWWGQSERLSFRKGRTDKTDTEADSMDLRILNKFLGQGLSFRKPESFKWKTS